MRSLNTIVIHCSASPNGVAVTPEKIDGWHRVRGFRRASEWTDKFNPQLAHIGYHWIVCADGRLQSGRHRDEIGAHVAGHNANSIGICMVGTDRFFRAQWEALRGLICTLAYTWRDEYLPKSVERLAYPHRPALAIARLHQMGIFIVGHRDLSPDKNGDGKIDSRDWLKVCPGFDVADWLANDMSIDESLLDSDPAIVLANPVDRSAEGGAA